jgi:hypothetical protein
LSASRRTVARPINIPPRKPRTRLGSAMGPSKRPIDIDGDYCARSFAFVLASLIIGWIFFLRLGFS